MFHVILYQPEIPPNTGNVIRLCANAGAALHLIEPLGFNFDDRHLRRAGLDYHDLAQVQRHPSLESCLHVLPKARLFACSTRGRTGYADVRYQAGDALLFGPETRGLPDDIIDSVPVAQRLTIPMRPGNRSLNLSNAVSVILYEAWRQQGFSH